MTYALCGITSENKLTDGVWWREHGWRINSRDQEESLQGVVV